MEREPISRLPRSTSRASSAMKSSSSSSSSVSPGLLVYIDILHQCRNTLNTLVAQGTSFAWELSLSEMKKMPCCL